MMNSPWEQLRRLVEADFADADRAHDLGHLDRVSGLAANLAAENGGDPEIAAIAGYVHDYHRLMEKDSGRPVPPADAAPMIRDVLSRAGVDRQRQDGALAAVAATDAFTFADQSVDTTDITAACVRDADILDAMGAIGIARAFLYGGTVNEPMWVPQESLRDTYREGTTSSVVAHFYEKLVRLRDEIQTPAGKRIADERHHFLLEFLRRFHHEYGDLNTAPLSAVEKG